MGLKRISEGNTGVVFLLSKKFILNTALADSAVYWRGLAIVVFMYNLLCFFTYGFDCVVHFNPWNLVSNKPTYYLLDNDYIQCFGILIINAIQIKLQKVSALKGVSNNLLFHPQCNEGLIYTSCSLFPVFLTFPPIFLLHPNIPSRLTYFILVVLSLPFTANLFYLFMPSCLYAFQFLFNFIVL